MHAPPWTRADRCGAASSRSDAVGWRSRSSAASRSGSGRSSSSSSRAQPLDRGELTARRAARPDEVRVVGVREPVRARSRVSATTARSSSASTVSAAPIEREQRLDRLPALRVGDGMARALDDRRARCPRRARGGRAAQPTGRGRCGARGAASARADTDPAPRNAPRRYAARQQLRATTRRGGTVERGVPAIDDARGRQHARARRPSPRRGAGSASPCRTPAADTCGSRERIPLSRRSAKARRAAAPLPRSRWSAHSPAAAQGAGCRRRGRARRARRGGRTSRCGAIVASSSRTSSDVITARRPRARAAAA